MPPRHPKVKKREDVFALRTPTAIWHEEPSEQNPYVAERSRCHGYDVLELAAKRSFVEVLFLLFRGELPTTPQAQLLETAMVAFINPGPRHAATRAAMNAGIGRTDTAHILPIGLAIAGGAHLGGAEVSEAMRFLARHADDSPSQCAASCEAHVPAKGGDRRAAPGFGTRFDSIDPAAVALAKLLLDLPGSGPALSWASHFVAALAPRGMGWLPSGVAAAVFCDLGFPARAGAGLFQLCCAPGLLAHGLEMATQPTTAMPFPDGEHYVISEQARARTR